MATIYDPAYRELTSLLSSSEIKGVDPAVLQKLNTIKELFEKRHEYADNLSTSPSDLLNEITKATVSHPWDEVYKAGKTSWNINPRMISGVCTVKFLQFIISMVKAKRVLELGMFTGYTALGMAEALPSDGVLHTIEIEKYIEEMAKGFFERSPHGKKIHVHIGEAREILSKLGDEGQKFDVIFLDADKQSYRNYIDTILDKNMLASNGILLADNAFKLGEAYTAPHTPKDNPIHDFNSYVQSKPELQQVLLPIRDGVLAVKRSSEITGLP
ncbi:hypothetical protein LOTGIDRAFT_230087 [Lottia gigantea]|uniref:Catechol O-methyltransferase n=1 Tax=Lottia gigantea TaxID=225164 RepID=V4BBS8_LOTGI|nr:hypothetical protein LOTGIDRAFT_230087 [Lottia gigantea]ESP05056.1 hypothetical protein LOTGIDRAFT_230087 [Lottia gigantea]